MQFMEYMKSHLMPHVQSIGFHSGEEIQQMDRYAEAFINSAAASEDNEFAATEYYMAVLQKRASEYYMIATLAPPATVPFQTFEDGEVALQDVLAAPMAGYQVVLTYKAYSERQLATIESVNSVGIVVTFNEDGKRVTFYEKDTPRWADANPRRPGTIIYVPGQQETFGDSPLPEPVQERLMARASAGRILPGAKSEEKKSAKVHDTQESSITTVEPDDDTDGSSYSSNHGSPRHAEAPKKRTSYNPFGCCLGTVSDSDDEDFYSLNAALRK